jgi:hypothetical protein
LILRVLRARVIVGEEERLHRFIRVHAVAQALRTPGLVSFQPAVRESRAGTELVLVSTWTGFDDLAGAGGDLDSPIAVAGIADMVADSRAEHYELVIGQSRSLPLREGKLRLIRIPIRPNLEATYYAAVREWSERLLDESGLVSFTLGRRVVARQDEIIAAMVFESEAALREAAGDQIDRPMGGEELSQYWAADPAIEHFDALTAADPRPDAPAILLMDDSRRYVHATPAATRLMARPLARLLTMRVDELVRPSERQATRTAWDQLLAEGSMRGPYVIARPDGSEVGVRFAAKSNAPWPGSHASVLVPEDDVGDPDELDVDRALVEAGLVAADSR